MESTELPQIITREITIVDSRGKRRMRLAVDEDGTAAVKFFDRDEQLRMALYLKGPEEDAEELLMEDREAALIITEGASGRAVVLGITTDGLSGPRPRLEITEGAGFGRQRHRFPARPPTVDD